MQQGRLRDSAAYWRKALAVIQERETWDSFPLPLISWVFIRLSEILYELNEPGNASDHVSWGLERSELGGDVRAMIAGYPMAGRLKLTAGDIAAADECLERARPLVENAPFPDWIGRFRRLRLECWLAQDRLRTAVELADEMLRGNALEGQPESEVAHLAMTRVLIVKGVRLPETPARVRSILRQNGHGASLNAGRIPDEFVQWRGALTRDTDSMRNERDMVRATVSWRGWRPGLTFEDAELAGIQQLTLYVYGAADSVGTVDLAKHAVDLLLRAELYLVDDGGHIPWFDDLSQVGSHVSRFLAR